MAREAPPHQPITVPAEEYAALYGVYLQALEAQERLLWLPIGLHGAMTEVKAVYTRSGRDVRGHTPDAP